MNADKPEHIAIIMDGNGRWAKAQHRTRFFGHQQGVHAARSAVECCLQQQIPYLTLFAFSSENWTRPSLEIKWLMRLLKRGINQELPQLHQNGIKVQFLGRHDRLSADILKQMAAAEHLTQDNDKLHLQIALDYGGRWDITQAMQKLARQVELGFLKPDDINEGLINNALSTHGIPEPDLLIRTSGEVRLSNFCLWQLAYSEFVFTDVHWPEFDADAFNHCLAEFSQRQRRFGLTSEQLELDHA